MADNKENPKISERSRIPVLSSRLKRVDELNKPAALSRDPLKTLSNQNMECCLAGPSRGIKGLDTRHVTHRNNKNEELDWNFEVFKDSINKCARDASNKENKGNLNVPTKNQVPIKPAVVKETPSQKTPANVDSLRKVKRSLKRPHSVGLQAAATPISEKAYQCTVFLSREITLQKTSCFDYLNRDYALDNLKYMLLTEKKVAGERNIRKASRSCIINWIININGATGNPAIVQLATWYLDGYLATATVAVDRLQVLAAACFWIAAKFHGRSISSRRLVKYSGHAFVETELVATERNILSKLMKFESLPITPHDFVPYLSWCCDQSGTGMVEAAAVFLCQCGIMIDKTLSEEYPSVVAAAAVKNALLLLRQTTSMDELKSSIIYKASASKASDLNQTCAQLRKAVRMVASVGFEYKAPLFKFAGPPHCIANKIIRAVNYTEVVSFDTQGKAKE